MGHPLALRRIDIEDFRPAAIYEYIFIEKPVYLTTFWYFTIRILPMGCTL